MEIWMSDLRSVRYLWCWWGLHWKIKPQLSLVSYIYHCDDSKWETGRKWKCLGVLFPPLVLLNRTSQAQPQMFTLKLFFISSGLSRLHSFILSSSPGSQEGFLSSELFHLLGVGEFSQLLTNFKISQSLHIIIPGRSHAQCWFSAVLHNSSPNILISYIKQPGQLSSPSLLTNCSKVYNFLACF